MAFADIEVDHRWHRHIIGKSGSNIGRIKNETGTSINIPPDTEKSNTIRIEGSPEGVAAAKNAILNMAQKMDNEKSRDIIIEQRYHKNIIGQKGEKVREIRDKFTELQISFPEAGAKSDVVTLRGPRDDVDKCYNHLKRLVADIASANYRLEVPIFKRFHGNIIGRNGGNIKKIKEETGTTIDIPAENSDSNIIVITGYKDQTHKARDMIVKIQSELANIVTVEVKIPQKLHTSMIGPGGKLIQSIMTECGDVHIRFPPEGTKSDVITLRGTKEDVEKAQVQLKKLEEERMENSFTVEVTAKPEHHRFLIGRGGINIQKVREKTGARIMFPSRNDKNQELITIMGKKEAVEEAKKELMSKIKDLNNIVEGEVNIDPKYHKHLVSRRAQVLRDLADEYGGVNISLPKDQTSSKISLKGARDCVDGAKQRLLEIVNDLESMVEVECAIPQEHHRGILGNKGKDIQEITSKWNVQIKFPEWDRSKKQADSAAEDVKKGGKSNIIMVSGKKENVEKAKNALLALVPISEEVDIPFKFHNVLIGKRGEHIRYLMDEFLVNIAVPKAHEERDSVVVTGAKKRVENAITALIQMRDDWVDKNYELVVNVPVEYHSNIIGRGGAVIKDLREKNDVIINIPHEREGSSEIRLIGFKNNCEAVRRQIEDMVTKLEQQVSIEVEIDNRCHSRIIGQKGKNIRRLMEKFNVDVRFPRDKNANPNLVSIIGCEEDCEQCKEHLQMLEEEYMDEVLERLEEKNIMATYTVPHRRSNDDRQDRNPYGYVVKDAPWNQQATSAEYVADADNTTDFPSLGGKDGGQQQGQAWGPWSPQ